MTGPARAITLFRLTVINVGVNHLGTTKGGIRFLTVTPTVVNTVVTVMMTRGAVTRMMMRVAVTMGIMRIGP